MREEKRKYPIFQNKKKRIEEEKIEMQEKE